MLINAVAGDEEFILLSVNRLPIGVSDSISSDNRQLKLCIQFIGCPQFKVSKTRVLGILIWHSLALWIVVFCVRVLLESGILENVVVIEIGLQ